MRSRSLHNVEELLDMLERTTGEPGNLTVVLQNIASTAQTFFAANACVIFAINPITSRFIESQTFAGNQLNGKTSFEQPRPEGLAQRVLKLGVLLVGDLEATPEYHSTFTRSESMRSFAALALCIRHNQRPLGVLYLDFKQQQQFNLDDRELLQIFAEQASFILQEAWLLQRYQEVARIGQEINHELATVGILFQKLQEHAASILDISHTLLLAVYQPQSDTLDLYLEEEGHFSILENDPLEGACQYVMDTQQVLFVRQYSKEAKYLSFQLASIARNAPGEALIFVPIVLRGASLGVLSIQHSEPDAYTQEDLYILRLLANHIAVALSDMQSYTNLSRLNQIGQLLTQQLDSEQVLQVIVDNIRGATLADLVVLYPYEADHQRFVHPPRVAGTLLASTSIQAMSSSHSDDFVSQALHYTEPVFTRDSATNYNEPSTDVLQQGSFQQREKIRSTAVIPLRVKDESVGVLFVNFRQPQRFNSSQRLLIEGLGHYAAIAIKNAQEFGTLSQRHMRELETLQSMDNELNRNLDLQSVLDTILRKAQECIPSEKASILLCDPHTQILRTAATIDLNAETSRKQIISLESSGIARWVVEQKEPVHVNNIRRDSQWRDLHTPVAGNIISELGVPLLDGEEVVGVLDFESSREAAFSQEDQDFLRTLAAQAVLAIKKAQVYESEKRLVKETQDLNEVSKEITSQLDLLHVFDLILDRALDLTNSTNGNLMLYDPGQNDLWMARQRGVLEEKKDRRQRFGEGIVGYVAKNKKLINVRDVFQPPWSELYKSFIPGMRSELAVPMLAGNDLRGVLNVESHLANNFSDSDERLLTGLASLAVVALQNAQAYEREKRLVKEAQALNEEAQALYQISKEITSQLDPARVLDLILDKALVLTDSHMGNVLLYDRNRKDLWMATQQGVLEDKRGRRQKLGEGIAGYAAEKKTLVNAKDVSQDPWHAIFLEYILGTRSELAIPLLMGNDLRGVLNVESPVPNRFGDSDERLLTGLAGLAVVALQNAQAYEREKDLVEEAQALNQISKDITSQLDAAPVFDLILEKALELTHSLLGALQLYDPEQNDLWIAAVRGMVEDKKGSHLGLNEGIVGYVARNKHLLNVDITQDRWKDIYLELVPETRFELAVPLLAGDNLRGVLNIESRSKNFTEHDEHLLTGLADLAVVALQNAERYEKAQREAQRFQLLYETGRELSKLTEWTQVEKAYDIILQIVEKYGQCQVGIYGYDDNTHKLTMIRASQAMELDEDFNKQVLQEHFETVIHTPSAVSIQQSDPKIRSLVITPIMLEDRYYGNLVLSHQDFQDTDATFTEGLAQQLADTIYRLETAKARQELEQMSSIGQSAMGIAHRLGSDLGLVEFHTSDIRSELEKLEVTNEFISERLQDIVRSVQSVLSFSRALKQELTNQGTQEETAGEPTLILPKALLEEVRAVVSLPANVQILLEVDDEVATVRVIHSLVADILQHLIANATHAMPGGGKITLRAYNTGPQVALEVIDTGDGIPRERLPRVFDLFYSTKGSSGFGLWSARRNALRNHGNLKVASVPGEGTTFTLLLPRAGKP